MVEKSHTSGGWPSVFEPFRTMGRQVADWFAPASEAAVTEDSYKVVVELPGVVDKDIDVSVHDGVLTVKGEKTSSREETGETWYFSERQYGAFSRSFRLPPDADERAVTADLKDGVLTVSVAKAGPSSPETRRIEVRKG
jgi:HSP20 family protein